MATGFYRTGNHFFFKELGVTPDILILSKSINNGILPFGAVVISKEIEDALKGKHIEHFSTQNGNLLGVLSAKITFRIHFRMRQVLLAMFEKSKI